MKTQLKLFKFSYCQITLKRLQPVFLLFATFIQSFAQAPIITSIAPISGPVGTTITITGTNFDPTPANNIVYIGATRAAITFNSTTQILVIVPTGATHSPITVINASTGLVANSNSYFIPTFSSGSGSITTSYFKPKEDIDTEFPYSYSVAIGDLDGDGRADLAVVDSDNNSNFAVSVLRNTSSGGTLSYAPKIDYATGPFPSAVSIGDLDGDGKLDIVVTNSNSNTISIFRNTGNAGSISFAARIDFATGQQPYSVAIGDVDGDGKNDLAIGNRSVTSPSISILLNTGITGAIAFAAKIDLAGIASVRSVIVNELDGDGKADLAVTDGNFISIFRNTGSPGNISFATKVNFAADNPGPIAAGDVDGDGKIDLATGNINGTDMLYVFRNTSTVGNISYAGGVGFTVAGPNVYSLAFGDLSGDARIDLAAISVNAEVVSVFGNSSTPGALSLEAKVNFSTGPQPWAIAIGDLDSDGKPDLAVSKQSGSNTVSILRTGAPLTPTITSFSPASGPIGTTVTITGTNFDATPTNNVVKFNGTDAATPTAVSETSLSVIVPAGATSGLISLTTPAGTAISPVPFIIDASFTPFGNTVNLTGAPDHIEVTDHPALRPLSLTIEAWIKASTLQDFGLVASKPVGNLTQNSYALWFEGGKLAGGVNPIGLATAVTYDWVPVIDQWYHLAFTYDNNTQTQALYLNGAIVATGTGSTPDYDAQPFMIGADINFGTLGAHFPGFMDELRLWNVARTQSEIQAALNATLLGTEPGLIAYYKMDEVGRGASLTVTNSAIATGTQLDGFTYGTTCTPVFTLNSVSISSFDPLEGTAGATITIEGNNFDATAANNTVTFNGTAALVIVASTTSLTVVVPAGAVTGPITVTNLCGTQTITNTNFNVICTPPAPPTGSNTSRCGVGSITLSASGGTVGQYRWYTVATGGTHDASQTNSTFVTPALTATTSYWVAINDGTCESSRTEVIATVLPLPTAPVIQPVNPVCAGSDITLTATGGTDGEYRWYDGATPISGEVNSTLVVTNLTFAKPFSAAITDGTCESNKTSVIALIKSCTAPSVESTVATAFVDGIVAINLQNLISDPEDDLDPASLQIIEQPQSGAAAMLEGFNLNIDYSGIAFSGTDRVTVGICDLTNLCTEQAVTIELGGEIKIYNAVSPNGDGKNEIFFIQYIDLLPETQRNSVTIYNRWGDEVFQTKNYNNTSNVFKGQSNTGDKLPSGTYFYKIIFISGKSRTGFLELKH